MFPEGFLCEHDTVAESVNTERPRFRSGFRASRDNQSSSSNWAPHDISVVLEPILGHLRERTENDFSYQHFQHVLSLFSKSSAFFLHSTCWLSETSVELWMKFSTHFAPLSMNATLRAQNRRGRIMLTALFLIDHTSTKRNSHFTVSKNSALTSTDPTYVHTESFPPARTPT